MTESSGTLPLKTLFGRVEFAAELASTSAGGVVPTDVVPIEPGDLREFEFNGSAECCRLSCNSKSVQRFKTENCRSSYLNTPNAFCQFSLVPCIFRI